LSNNQENQQELHHDYARSDMDALCVALREIDLSLTMSESSDDINIDWKHWKETYLSTVSKHVPKKKSTPESAAMDKRRYSPPDQEKRVHSKEIENQSQPTSARKIQEIAFRSQTITSRKP
jgi:hypothetical protein